jgi:low temperature requirement protein LtrA
VAFVVTFLLTALIWRIYIFRAGEDIGPAIATSAKPNALGNLMSYPHLIMIIGVVVSSVGYALVIERPFGHPQAAGTITILGGPALFLAGRTILQYLVFGHVWSSRLIGLVALACLVPPMLFVPSLVIAIAAGTVLTGILIADNRIARGQNPPVFPPGPHRPSDK